jgi:uncharacterized membrane protein YesL
MMVAGDKTNGRSPSFDWMELFNTVTTFILLNMLWLFGALLIVTIPAVTAALFASMIPWSRGQSPVKPFTTFWLALKKYWLKATAVFLLDLLLIAFVILNLLILRQMGTGQFLAILSRTVTVLVAALLILSNIYLWPLLVTVDPPLRDLLKNGIKLALVHPLWGALVAILALTPVAPTLFRPQAFLLTATFAATALNIQWGGWSIIRRYLDENEIQNLGV